MDQSQMAEIAKTLHTARLEARSLTQFSANIENFKRSDAYTIQEMGIEKRKEAGEKVIGLKMGLTSEGKRKQMNLDAPLYGVLTDKMQIAHNEKFNIKGSIHPKIEPEIVFYIKDDLRGSVSREEVLSATEFIGGALEILDSRYTGFKYFSMEDVISDNSSSSHYILGPKLENFHDLDLKNLKMKMKLNGEIATEGMSSAISDDPVVSVIQLSELLGTRDQYIPAGSFVLAGAATAAVNLEAGMEFELEIEGLSATKVTIV